MVNSRYRLVSATSGRSPCELVHVPRPSFSRSYGCNLPSSLTGVLSRALVFSTSLPVSVYGTDTIGTPREAFLGSLDSIGLWRSSASSTSLGLKNLRLFLQVQPTDLNPLPDLGRPILLRHSTLHSCPWWCRNIDLLAIAYAFRPRLRFRLTLGGRALPRKP